MSNIDHIHSLIEGAAKTAGLPEIAFEVSYDASGHGDFAANYALKAAKAAGKAPRDLAQQVVEGLHDDSIASAEVAGPGFINIVMTQQYWGEELAKIAAGYGSSDMGKGHRVQVEFISANPTGPLTLGNARGGFLGDAIANVLSAAGYDVTREYYFNDAGTQIKKLAESVKVAGGVLEAEEVQYKGAYIQDLAKKYQAELTGDEQTLANLLTRDNFETFIRDAIDRMHIGYDVWFNEQELMHGGGFERALARLKEAGLIYDQDGATWLKSSELGDERDRVLVKGSGDVTYLGNDIAYHINIFEERGFDKAIKLWGADHAGQVPSLVRTMKRLLPGKQLEFVIIQWVRLMQEGKEVKMSKRAGTFVTVQDLIDELDQAVGVEYGAAVARFFFLMRSPDSQMDFDLDLATEQSQKNPLFYVMYSYARAHSLLNQAKERGLKVGTTSSIATEVEQRLVKAMTRLPGLVSEMARDYGVHRLTFYGMEMAGIFHDFYEGAKIVDMKPKEAAEKLYLIQQYIVFMETYFQLLGVTPQSKM